MMRKQVLVNATRAQFFGEPERNAKIAVGGIRDVLNRDVIAVAVEDRPVKLRDGVAMSPNAQPRLRRVDQAVQKRNDAHAGVSLDAIRAAGSKAREQFLALVKQALRLLRSEYHRRNRHARQSSHKNPIRGRVRPAAQKDGFEQIEAC